MTRLAALLCCMLSTWHGHAVTATTSTPGFLPVGNVQTGENWTGLKQTKANATLTVPGDAVFTCPDGPRGGYKHGYRTFNDSAVDWKNFFGLQCGVSLPADREVELTFTLCAIGNHKAAVTPGYKSTVLVHGAGPHTVTLPWSAFDFPQARTSFLKFIKQLTIAARFTDKRPGNMSLLNVRVIKAPLVALECAVRGKSAPKGGTAEYQVTVQNCTDATQSVALAFVHHGWEEMAAAVEPIALRLEPGESKPCTVRVNVSEKIPAGGHETQVLQAVADGNAATATELEFITASELPHPYILHTPQRWQEVREKVKHYAWAKEQQAEMVKQANDWKVPEVTKPPKNDPDDTMGPFLFPTITERGLMNSAMAWQLTGNKEFAKKVALFLKRLSNPADGYPVTLRGCNQSLVQEGHWFQHIAKAYDMILDSGVLTPEDRTQIESTFRVFIETMERANDSGSINNWNLSEVTGACYCALAMQDLVTAKRFFAGPGGICDQLSKGTMDDGWWYECSIGYNMWCASEFTQAALALEPWGLNFKTAWLPASYSAGVMLASELSGGSPDADTEEARHKPFGMNPDLFGPLNRPYRTITNLWNSLLPFLDYRCIMFGVNDSAENQVAGNRTEVGGQPFEIAYYVYRDPAYAAVIKRGGSKRDLIYGVPELPEKTPEQFRDSAYADNVGLVMLRSKAPNRPIREQIQAALHYGTHGWAHGHYDRTDLLALSRFGRNFWNPESVFYVYEPFMYKFFTQTSVNHNMVVVDEKMQEATPGKRLLFHTGTMMQATAVEATARWSNPPYGGMVYDYVPVKSFAEKCWREGRSVPLPRNPPKYGSLTDYSEPVLQRRLMLVTDDYVVLADYLRGAKPHTFESLVHLKGFKGIDAKEKDFLRHDAQWNPDPVGSAQFVTDCDWFGVKAPAVARFEERWGPGADEEGSRSIGNEPGVLKLDVHTLWPKSQEVMIGAAPEFFHVEKKLYYTVRAGGKTLAEGKFGPWVLGQEEIDVPIDGRGEIELETKVEDSRIPTVFWGNARLVTKSGKEIALGGLPLQFDNIEQPKAPGQDYLGGPVKIVGVEYKNATPGQPHDQKQPGRIRVSLAGLDAVRFKATLGGDYPVGNEAERRKTFAVRAPRAADARFLTLIEPYEQNAVVKSAEALGENKLRVTLTDERVQEIDIRGLDGTGQDIAVQITESQGGQIVRKESSSPKAQP